MRLLPTGELLLLQEPAHLSQLKDIDTGQNVQLFVPICFLTSQKIFTSSDVICSYAGNNNYAAFRHVGGCHGCEIPLLNHFPPVSSPIIIHHHQESTVIISSLI